MDILKRDIRETIVSGLFYPEEPEELSRKIETLMRRQDPEEISGSVQTILCPHGSWEHCGESIASAFASIRDFKPDRILLLGPVHREKSGQNLYLSSKKYFATPLGLISVDRKSCKKLTGSSDIFTIDDSPHMEEHALELQLPFIKRLFPESPIIPVLAGNLKRSLIKKAAAILRKELLDQPGNTLIVLSANLSRFALLSESEKESESLMNHIDMPLQTSILELEKNEEISSCGTVLFTLLSDLGLYSSDTGGKLHLLKREHSEIIDKKGKMAVFYAGGRWLQET